MLILIIILRKGIIKNKLQKKYGKKQDNKKNKRNYLIISERQTNINKHY